MPRNQVGNTSYLLPLLLLLLPLLLLHSIGCLATPTKAPTVAAPAAAQVIGATSLAATRAAVYAARDNQPDDDDDGDAGDDDNKRRNQLEDLMPANLLLEDLQQPNGQLINLTRHHDGDIFYTNGTLDSSTPNPQISHGNPTLCVFPAALQLLPQSVEK